MKVYGLWHGGSSYGIGGPTDVEEFASIQAAKDALSDRSTDGYSYRQTFNYIAREPEATLCPAVGPDDSITIWFSNPLLVRYDGRVMTQWAGNEGDWSDESPYPDRMIERGPKGGIVVNNC